MDTTMAGAHNRRYSDQPARRRLRRAVRASLIAAVVIGCVYVWQQAFDTRIANRAEQARVNALQLTPRKMQALEREAARDAGARAYAERAVAEQASREAQPAAQPTAATADTRGDPPI